MNTREDSPLPLGASPQELGDETGTDSGSTSYESFFRDASLAQDSALSWALEQRQPLIDAVRGLLGGPQAIARLRLWCFLELSSLPQARLTREDVNLALHALKPEALEMVLRRLRELGLLVWDATAQDYSLSLLAQQVQALLAPLTRSSSGAEDDDMASLLSQVAGAQALGLADANQLKHLHARLARLHDEFAEAITSGSEAMLRAAQPRFERALKLVERAGEALTALIRSDFADLRLEREARALGQAQARLLSMASRFTYTLQQADRRRVTLGSTGLTSSDVRNWLQGLLQSKGQDTLKALLEYALSTGVQPVFISGHDLLDVAEAEFERDRPDPERAQGLPEPVAAQPGEIETLKMPAELGGFIEALTAWSRSEVAPHEVSAAVVPGRNERYAQAAYRMQLLPLLGDAQARELQGQTGDFARLPWRVDLTPEIKALSEETSEHVAAISTGQLAPESEGQFFPESAKP